MINFNEIEELEKIVGKSTYNQKSPNKYKTKLKFIFSLTYNIHINKFIPKGIIIFFVCYFFIAILFDIIGTFLDSNFFNDNNIQESTIIKDKDIINLQLYKIFEYSAFNKIIVNINNFFHYDYLLVYDSNEYLIYFFLIFIILFFVLCFIKIILNDSHKSTIIIFLIIIMSYLSYFLLLPLIMNYSNKTFLCYLYYNNSNIPSSYCIFNKNSQTFYINIFILFLNYVFLIIVSYIFFGINRYSNQDIYNRLNTQFELLFLNYYYIKMIFKIISITNTSLYLIFAIFNFIFFALIMLYFNKKVYYFNKKIHSIIGVFIFCLFTTSISTLVLYFIKANESGIIIIIINIISIPTYLFYENRLRYKNLIKFNIENNISIKEFEMYIDDLYDYFEDKQNLNKSRIFNGIFHNYINSSIKYNFKKIGHNSYYLPISNETFTPNNKNYDVNYIMFMNLIYDLYSYFIYKTNYNFDFLINFSNFLNYSYGNKFMTIFIIQKTLDSSTSFDQKIYINTLIECFNKSIHCKIDDDLNMYSLDNLSVVFFYEKLSLQMINQIIALCIEQQKFWKKIITLEKSETFENQNKNKSNNEYFEIAKKINILINEIENIQFLIHLINPQNQNQVQRIYECYKHYLIEDEEFKINSRINIEYNKILDKYLKYFDDNSTCLIVDISEEIGKIINFTKNFPKLLGFTKQVLYDKNVNIILPNSISSKHNDYLKIFQKTGKQVLVEKRDRKVYIKDFQNIAYPSLVAVFFLPFLDSKKIYLIGNLQVQKNLEEFIITNSSGRIDMANIKNKNFKLKDIIIPKLEIYIQFLIPELIDYCHYKDKNIKLNISTNINNTPIFIPYLLHDSYFLIKDKNILIKKLHDYFYKLKELMIKILCDKQNNIDNSELKEEYYNLIIENSIRYQLMQENNGIIPHLEDEDDNSLYITSNIEFDTIKIGKIELNRFLIKSITYGYNYNSNFNSNEILLDCLERNDKKAINDIININNKCIKLFYIKEDLLKRKSKDIEKYSNKSSSINFPKNKFQTRNEIMFLRKIDYISENGRSSFKMLNKQVDNINNKSKVLLDFDDYINKDFDNISLKISFKNPLRVNDLVDKNFMNIFKMKENDPNKSEQTKLIQSKYELQNKCFYQSAFFYKSNQENIFNENQKNTKENEDFINLNNFNFNNNDTYSNSSLISIKSDNSHIKQIQKLKKGIFSKKNPKLLSNLKVIFNFFFVILVINVVGYTLWTKINNLYVENISLAFLQFNKIPLNLACINNYIKNSYLIYRGNYSYNRYNTSDEDDNSYFSFVNEKIRNCSDDLNGIILNLEKNELINQTLSNSFLNIEKYNKNNKWLYIENNINLYEALNYIIFISVNVANIYNENKNNNLTLYRNDTKYELDYNIIFSNVLNNIYDKIELNLINSENYLNQKIDDKFFNFLIVFIIISSFIFIGMFIFKYFQNNITIIEICILNILFDYSNITYIREKFKLIYNFQSVITKKSKENLNLTVDDLEIEYDGLLNDEINNFPIDEIHSPNISKKKLGNTKSKNKHLKIMMDIKKTREKMTIKTLNQKTFQNNLRILIIIFVIFLIIAIYFAFNLLWNYYDMQKKIDFVRIYSKLNKLQTGNILSFIIIKEFISQNQNYGQIQFPFRFRNFTSMKEIINNNFPYLTEQDQYLEILKSNSYKNNKIRELWDTIFYNNTCSLYYKNESVESKMCYSIENGVLSKGLYQGINLFNDNIRQLINLINSTNILENINNEINFDLKSYSTCEKLIDFFLSMGYNDFFNKIANIFLEEINFNNQIVLMVLIIFLFILLIFFIYIHFFYFKYIQIKFTEILTLLCILPSKSINHPSILSKLKLLELE